MLETIKNMLQCPSCSGDLEWTHIKKRDENFIVEASIECLQCHGQYAVDNEIAYFLTNLDRNDLWKKAESGITKYLNDNPDIKDELMTTPIQSLHPTDLFFRASLIEEQGNYAESEQLFEIAEKKIYTKEYIECSKKQIDFIKDLEIPQDDIILDIASGKGYLVFKLLNKMPNHIIMSDFSPVVMRKNKKRLEYKNYLNKASLMVFDSRKTPFKNSNIKWMTSFLGLGNIEDNFGLIKELKRILLGDFYSIMFFFKKTDSENINFIMNNKISNLNILSIALEEFKKVDFSVELLNTCESFCKPTQVGEIIDANIDALPIHETIIDWKTIHIF